MSPVSNAVRRAPEAEPAPAAHSSPAAPAALLRFAHMSLSAALRHDYFSNGKGHQQSKAVLSVKAAKPARKRPLPELAQADHAAESDDAGADIAEAAAASHLDDGALLPPAEAGAAGIDARASDAGPDLAARYFAEIAHRRRLTSSEEYHLASRAGDGDLQARHHLIEHHLGLVVMMARRYVNRGLPLLDLIEEGNLGLITASAKFDPELGFRFSTYAKWWIRQGIELALMTQSRLVRLPIHLSRSVKQAARQQAQKRSSGSAQGEAGAAGDPMAGLGPDLLALLDHDDREGGALIDELPAGEDASPEAHLSSGQRRAQLSRMLGELSDKEQRVIEGRYALRQPEPRTLDDIARELKLSCERVRQIEKEALQKLRRLFDDHGIAVDMLF